MQCASDRRQSCSFWKREMQNRNRKKKSKPWSRRSNDHKSLTLNFCAAGCSLASRNIFAATVIERDCCTFYGCVKNMGGRFRRNRWTGAETSLVADRSLGTAGCSCARRYRIFHVFCVRVGCSLFLSPPPWDRRLPFVILLLLIVRVGRVPAFKFLLETIMPRPN